MSFLKLQYLGKKYLLGRSDHELQLDLLLLLPGCCVFTESTSGFLQKEGTNPLSILSTAGHSQDSLAPCPDATSGSWTEENGSVDRPLPFSPQVATRDCFWLEKWGPQLPAVSTEGLISVVGTRKM